MQKLQALVWVVALVALPAGSSAADRWVSQGGNDVLNDCLTVAAPCKSLERALTVAVPSDTINVAAGTYRVRLELRNSTTLTLLGGWDAAFTTRDPDATPTVLKARPGALGDKRVVLAIAEAGETISLEIDGFVLTGGNARVYGNALLGYAVFESMFQDGGGGLYALGAGGSVTMTVRRSVVTRNRSSVVAGGGVFVGASLGGSADVTFDRVMITDNRVDYGGGMELLSKFGDPTPASVHVRLVNSIVAGNRAKGSAAIFALQDGAPCVLDLVDSTIVANRARGERDEDPEGAIVLNQATANITNTILWGNLLQPPGPGADLDVGQNALANVSYSDVGSAKEVAGGVLNDLGGNLSVDPQLVDFALAATSPLIDVGTCTGAPAVDFEGDPRPSGVTCDVGADELVP